MIVDISTIATVAGTGAIIVSGIVARDRYVTSTINNNYKELSAKINEEHDAIRDEIALLRDKMHSDFVKHSDVDRRFEEISKQLTDLRKMIKDNNTGYASKLDQLIGMLSGQKT